MSAGLPWVVAHTSCDAPIPRGPLITRQPRNIRGCRVTRHHPIESPFSKTKDLKKIEQSLLCTGSSTQNTTCPNIAQRPHRVHIRVKMSKNGHLDPYINTHQNISNQLYYMVQELINHFYTKVSTKATCRLSSQKWPLVSIVLPYTPCT